MCVTTITNMTEHRVYQRASSHQSVDEWDEEKVGQIVQAYLRDRRTRIERESGNLDGDPEVVGNVIRMWLNGIETPTEYFEDVRKFLGPECKLIFRRHVFGEGDGASLGSKPRIEFDAKAAVATLRYRTMWAFIQFLLLIGCIFGLLFFGSKLRDHWEGYDRPWTGLWQFLV